MTNSLLTNQKVVSHQRERPDSPFRTVLLQAAFLRQKKESQTHPLEFPQRVSQSMMQHRGKKMQPAPLSEVRPERHLLMSPHRQNGRGGQKALDFAALHQGDGLRSTDQIAGQSNQHRVETGPLSAVSGHSQLLAPVDQIISSESPRRM